MQTKLSPSVWRFVCFFAVTFAFAGHSQLEADEPLELYITNCLQHNFLDYNVLRVDKFSLSDEPKKTAELFLDTGKTIFNAFGDLKEPDQLEGISVDIALVKIPMEDPTKRGRRLYAVTPNNPPKALQNLLGKNQIHLVWTPPMAERPGSIRLLLVSPGNKVYQTVDLRQNGT